MRNHEDTRIRNCGSGYLISCCRIGDAMPSLDFCYWGQPMNRHQKYSDSMNFPFTKDAALHQLAIEF